MKVKCYIFRCYKQESKTGLVYLESKMEKDMYSWEIFQVKRQETSERTYSETSKQQTRYRWYS